MHEPLRHQRAPQQESEAHEQRLETGVHRLLRRIEQQQICAELRGRQGGKETEGKGPALDAGNGAEGTRHEASDADGKCGVCIHGPPVELHETDGDDRRVAHQEKEQPVARRGLGGRRARLHEHEVVTAAHLWIWRCATAAARAAGG